MLKGFKDFLMRGTVVDLAVAVVIGAAFAKVVGGLLQGVINPLIASVAGKPNLDSVGTFTLNEAKFSIGLLLTPLCQLRVRRRRHLLHGGHAPEQAG
jgi:large conductance mechanosensitive channel